MRWSADYGCELPRSQRRDLAAGSSQARFDGDLHGDARHVPDPASIVRACSTLVKPGGWAFFHAQTNPKSFLFAIVGAEYVLKLLPRHARIRQDASGELAGHCRGGGLTCKNARHAVQPLTRHYWFSKRHQRQLPVLPRAKRQRRLNPGMFGTFRPFCLTWTAR